MSIDMVGESVYVWVLTNKSKCMFVIECISKSDRPAISEVLSWQEVFVLRRKWRCRFVTNSEK